MSANSLQQHARGTGAHAAAACAVAAAAGQVGRPLEGALDSGRPAFRLCLPYFKARIARDPCGYRLSKTGGTLSPLAKDRREFAFLGTSTVNDNPQGHYAPGNVSDGTNGNSVGRLVALGPDELLLILDSNDKSFELYQLIC
ncbi:hypothetical protein [Xanthomonas translucens]|uniref:hypothetical protein n=1 Tax=Xanthomonas campestris pv. translucens TaxID=343 RepID=UPI001F61B5C2|nr:hypothetical protein [Xanthomonas translucens]